MELKLPCMSKQINYKLAKRSLKEHKKNTATTVRGLAIGSIILIPIIRFFLN